jgi:hypothetical protein
MRTARSARAASSRSSKQVLLVSPVEGPHRDLVHGVDHFAGRENDDHPDERRDDTTARSRTEPAFHCRRQRLDETPNQHGENRWQCSKQDSKRKQKHHAAGKGPDQRHQGNTSNASLGICLRVTLSSLPDTP